MYSPVGIWGYTPPQLVLKRLVSDEQHHLKLVRAVERASELLDTKSELLNAKSELLNMKFELLNMKSELLKQMFEHFNKSLNPDLLEVEVCQKDARGSR
jgi:GTP-sensing pleiotropic transcriptional regulator CodY